MTMLKELFKDESGATAIEYGLIAALLSVAIIAALSFVSGQLENTYTKIGTALETGNT
ncbi:MAG: Flp family type IVb pilin [Rickettsiales bacterium]|nr:Flp family type IVb pilin [Rickettsiales bacterium]